MTRRFPTAVKIVQRELRYEEIQHSVRRNQKVKLFNKNTNQINNIKHILIFLLYRRCCRYSVRLPREQIRLLTNGIIYKSNKLSIIPNALSVLTFPSACCRFF